MGKSAPVVVELGVLEGELTFGLYDRGWTDAHYVLVDPWAPPVAHDSEAERQRMADMHVQVELGAAERNPDNFQIHRTDALAMSAFARSGEADLVYIDYFLNKPIYRKVVEAWWPIVKPGGILAGHDFARYPEIESVVRAFAAERSLDIGLLPDSTTKARLDELKKPKNAWQCQIWHIAKPMAPEPEPEPEPEHEDLEGGEDTYGGD